MILWSFISKNVIDDYFRDKAFYCTSDKSSDNYAKFVNWSIHVNKEVVNEVTSYAQIADSKYTMLGIHTIYNNMNFLIDKLGFLPREEYIVELWYDLENIECANVVEDKHNVHSEVDLIKALNEHKTVRCPLSRICGHNIICVREVHRLYTEKWDGLYSVETKYKSGYLPATFIGDLYLTPKGEPCEKESSEYVVKKDYTQAKTREIGMDALYGDMLVSDVYSVCNSVMQDTFSAFLTKKGIKKNKILNKSVRSVIQLTEPVITLQDILCKIVGRKIDCT